MSAIITSIAKVKAASTEAGFLTFCKDHSIDPENFSEPEEGVMIDSYDLLRYGMQESHRDLKQSIAEITSTDG